MDQQLDPHAGGSELRELLEAQRRIIDELRARVDDLEARRDSPRLVPPVDHSGGSASADTDRRSFLRLAGVAAAGAAAVVVAGVQPAAAANNDTVTVGNSFSGTGTTSVTNSTAVSLPLPDPVPALPSGIKGVHIDNGNGVWGKADGSAGAGVLGESANGYGVLGTSTGGYSLYAGGLGRVGLGANLTAGPPAAGTYAVGDLLRDRAGNATQDLEGNLYVCVARGTPGTWRKIAGPGTAGAYHPISPTRVFDSRSGAIVGVDEGNARTVSVASVIPSGLKAQAATVNITVTQTVAGGYLTVYPANIALPNTSVLNWGAPNVTAANGTVIKLGTNNDFKVAALQSATHVLVDVMGYWA